jgi:hypothetical protein
VQCRRSAGRPPALHTIVRDTAPVLHVTNADSAVKRLGAAGAEGDILPWRDALHEGPVRGDGPELRAERARFIAGRGWATEAEALADMTARDERLDRALAANEEIVLWFESDLYDVLQLAQVLDLVAPGRARLILVGVEQIVGVAELSLLALRDDIHRDVGTLTEQQVAAARALWSAFRAPDPRGLEALQPGTVFAEAAHRHLQQFPWVTDGLNRSERALLQALASGARTREEAFVAAQRQEERPFLGDAIALQYLAALPTGDEARAILNGERQWTGRPERWLGGVHLPAKASPWRYDSAAGRLAYERS